MEDFEVTSVEDMKKYIGQETSVGDWVLVTQEMVDKFADATGDHQFIHVAGFNQIRIRSQLISPLDVFRPARSAQDENMQPLEPGLLANPGQYLEAAFPRQIQIEQQNRGQRKQSAVSILALSAQVSNHPLAIMGELQRGRKSGGFENMAHEQRVMFIIISDQDNGIFD